VPFVCHLHLRETTFCEVSSPAIWWRSVGPNYCIRRGVHSEHRHMSCLISWLEHVAVCSDSLISVYVRLKTDCVLVFWILPYIIH